MSDYAQRETVFVIEFSYLYLSLNDGHKEVFDGYT